MTVIECCRLGGVGGLSSVGSVGGVGGVGDGDDEHTAGWGFDVTSLVSRPVSLLSNCLRIRNEYMIQDPNLKSMKNQQNMTQEQCNKSTTYLLDALRNHPRYDLGVYSVYNWGYNNNSYNTL